MIGESNFRNNVILLLNLQQQLLQNCGNFLINFLDLLCKLVCPLGPKLNIVESIFIVLPTIQILN